METTVKVKCLSKKNALSYNGANPICCSIELAVPYDQTSIFYQMSGGTAMTLNTINDDAANMFEVGKDYLMTISPAE